MSDLTFLFFLVPGLMVPTALLVLWLVIRQQRRFRRDVFGEQNVPLFAAFFPTSGPGLRYHAQQYGTGGSHQDVHGGSSWGHGDVFSSAGHGSSHDHGSHDHGSYDSGCSSDSGSSGSSDSGSSCSSGSDSGSSGW